MSEKEQFYSFEEALKELRLKEEELKRLVSEGEIRAFREGDTMRLRRADVESLRSELSGGEVVDLGDVREDLVFEDDVQIAEDSGMATQEIGMATEAMGAEGETVLDEPEFEEEAAPVERRIPVARAVEAPEGFEGGALRTLLVATSVILILGLPLALALSTGQLNAVANALSGLFR